MATNKVREFFKVYMPQRCSKRLPLPIPFARYLPRPRPKTVLLRNSSGTFWTVCLTERQEQLFLENGWPEFVEDNDVKIGEFLVFAYDVPRSFYVSIYGHSGCLQKRGEVVTSEISNVEEEIEEVVTNDNDFNEDDDKDGDSDSDSVYSIGSEEETEEETEEEENSDEEVVVETLREKKHRMPPKNGKKGKNVSAIGKSKGRSRKIIPIENTEKYLDDPANPCFMTMLKNRNFELLVHSRLVKDFRLKFTDTVKFISPYGILEGRTARWGDRRACIKGWSTVCDKNNLKPEDRVICELLMQSGGMVNSIKVHIIRK